MAKVIRISGSNPNRGAGNPPKQSERSHHLERLAKLRRALRRLLRLYLEDLASYCDECDKTIRVCRTSLLVTPFLVFQYIDSIPASVVIKERDGRIVWANSDFEEWMGEPLHKLKGKTVFDLWPTPVAIVIDKHDQASANGRSMQVIEQVPARDGSNRLRLALRFPIRDRRGRVSKIASFSFDLPQVPFIIDPLYHVEILKAGVKVGGPRSASVA
jgi:PAS domain S-box-containing protein